MELLFSGGIGLSDHDKQRSAFRLGSFIVEPTRNRLTRDADEFPLEPRVMDVLCVLAENGDTVTSRQELLERLWTTQYGADESLTRAVSSLRRVVREAGELDAYVETIPKRGYRLLRGIEPLPDRTPLAPIDDALSSPDTPVAEATVSDGRRFPSRTLSGVVLLGAAAFAVFAALSMKDAPDEDATGANSGAQNTTELQAAGSVQDRTVSPDVPISIAVLPFRPLTDNPADRYFGDGIAEELQQILLNITALRVIARTSSFSIAEDTVSLEEMRKKLDVAYVVRGSVRRVGERVRVSARLVRLADGSQLWAESFDRELRDMLAVQDEIALSVASALQIRLDSQFAQDLQASPDIDPRAIELFYEALHHWSTRFAAKDGMRTPFDALRAAVDIEPDFTAAWALIGYFGTLADSSPAANEREAFNTDTEHALERALALDSDAALAHVGMALWKLQNDHEIERARYHLERALDLRPHALSTLAARLVFAWTLGDAETSLALIRQMKQRDPLNQTWDLQHATLLAQLGHFDEAFIFFDQCQATRCLGAGFVAYASTAVYMSGDSDRLARWAPVAEEFLSVLEKLPAALKPRQAELMPAVFAEWFGLPRAREKLLAAIDLLASDPITDGIGMWGPTIARHAPQELMMDLLERAADRGQFLSEPYALSPLYGFNPYPDTLLASPRYRRLWQREGLGEIKELRWHAGVLHGLPLE